MPLYFRRYGFAFAGFDDSLQMWGGVGVGLFGAIRHLGGSKPVTRKPTKLFKNDKTPKYTHTQVYWADSKQFATNLVKYLLKAGGMEYGQ